MKKIIIAACFLLSFAGIATAQKSEKKPAAAKEVKMAKTATAPVNPAAVSAPKKADGTLDKRYKANKEKAETPAGPLKKDGTPDKRFNANKKG